MKNILKTVFPVILILVINLYSAELKGGARNAALGGSGTALADELAGVILNPALINTIDSFSVSATTGLENLGLNGVTIFDLQADLGLPLNKAGNIGVHLNTIIAGNSGNGQADTVFLELQQEYGRQIRELAVAVSCRQQFLIVNKAESFSGIQDQAKAEPRIGIGLSLFYSKKDKINFGLAVDNLLSPLLSKDSELPLTVRSGMALGVGPGTLLTDARLEKYSGLGATDFFINSGYEFPIVNNKLKLRTGMELLNITEGFALNLGLGYNLKKILSFDYVLSMPLLGSIRAWGGSHILTITYNLPGK